MRTKPKDAKSSTNTVGYGSPPLSTRWKPGQSGNPKGRRKGSKSIETTMAGLLSKSIEIRENGQVRKITIIEALGRALIKKALSGDEKAITRLLEMEGKMQELSRLTEKRTRPATQQEAADAYMRLVRGPALSVAKRSVS